MAIDFALVLFDFESLVKIPTAIFYASEHTTTHFATPLLYTEKCRTMKYWKTIAATTCRF